MDALETIEYKGHTILVYSEEEPMNPRVECDNLGVMLCFHTKYLLGDKARRDKSKNLPSVKPYDFDGWDEMRNWLVKEEAAEVICPLYLYDHSGLTIKTSPFGDRWDSGQVGFIYARREDIVSEYGNYSDNTLSTVKAVLEAEVKEYDDYLTGNVYRYVIKNAAGEEVESCGNCSGDIKPMIEECKSIIDQYHTE